MRLPDKDLTEYIIAAWPGRAAAAACASAAIFSVKKMSAGKSGCWSIKKAAQFIRFGLDIAALLAVLRALEWLPPAALTPNMQDRRT
jgi:hypothetical protein